MLQTNEINTTTGLTDLQEIAYSHEGRTLLNQFYIMLRTAQLYSPDNKIFRRQTEQMVELLRSAHDQFGELTLQLRSGYFYFCGVRIRENMADFTAAKHLKELSARLGISGFLFLAPLSDQEVVTTFQLLSRLETSNEDGQIELERSLRHAGIENIEPLPPYEEDAVDQDAEQRSRTFARKTYFYMVDNLRLVTNRIEEHKTTQLTKTQRVIHAIVDQIVTEASYLLELTALKSHDEYTYLHSANVCIYAVSLGARLGLTKKELSDLGFAALFHDVGKSKMPADVLNKESGFSEGDWELVRQHPVDGVLTIASAMPFDDTASRAMLTCFEHHLNLDGSGYPTAQRGRDLNLYSKIVTICDVFDAMTSGRVYRKDPVSPERSLRMMLSELGVKFDPLLFKVFINVVSVYPPGTLLLLDSGELAVATARNSEDLFRPKAMLIGDAHRLYEAGSRIDLAERDSETGEYLRAIAKSIPPGTIDLDLKRYILSDA